MTTPNARQITSLSNPTVKAARALHLRKARRRPACSWPKA